MNLHQVLCAQAFACSSIKWVPGHACIAETAAPTTDCIVVLLIYHSLLLNIGLRTLQEPQNTAWAQTMIRPVLADLRARRICRIVNLQVMRSPIENKLSGCANLCKFLPSLANLPAAGCSMAGMRCISDRPSIWNPQRSKILKLKFYVTYNSAIT